MVSPILSFQTKIVKQRQHAPVDTPVVMGGSDAARLMRTLDGLKTDYTLVKRLMQQISDGTAAPSQSKLQTGDGHQNAAVARLTLSPRQRGKMKVAVGAKVVSKAAAHRTKVCAFLFLHAWFSFS